MRVPGLGAGRLKTAALAVALLLAVGGPGAALGQAQGPLGSGGPAPGDMPGAGGAGAAAVFVLVHGGWQGSWVWYRVKPLLEAAGHTVVAVQLPAHGTDTTPAANLTSLAAFAAPVLAAVRNATQPVILVGHSFAGACLSTVAEAAPEKISKLVYLAAFLLPNNGSILDLATQPRYGSLLGANLAVVPEARGPPIYYAINQSALVPALFSNSPAEVQQLGTLLYRDDFLAAFTSRLTVTQERWGRVPRYYVYSDNDNAIIPQLQQDMVAAQGVNGTFFVAGSDHELHLSKPVDVAQVLLSVAGGASAGAPGAAPGGAPGPLEAPRSGQSYAPKGAPASLASSGRVLGPVLMALVVSFVQLIH